VTGLTIMDDFAKWQFGLVKVGVNGLVYNKDTNVFIKL